MPKKAKTTNTRRLAGVCCGAWENRTPDILLAKRDIHVRGSLSVFASPRFSVVPVHRVHRSKWASADVGYHFGSRECSSWQGPCNSCLLYTSPSPRDS